jgi:hypothetical protein
VLVGGFTIVNPSANGVNINGVSSGVFRDLTIQGAELDGVLMMNSTGAFIFDDVTVAADDGINGAGGVAFHVNGGNAATTVSHTMSDPLTNPTFENSGGNINEVILIENTTGGFVNLAPTAGATAANDDGGLGIRVLNNFGNVTLGAAQISNTDVTGLAGVEIRNNTSNVTINGDITIDNAANTGFLVEDVPATGTVNVSGSSNILVDNRNGIGADFRNVSGQVRFTQGIGVTAPSSLVIGPLLGATDAHPAVRFSASTGTVALNDLTIADSLAEGILIGDPLGVDINSFPAQFTATGTTTINNVGSLDDLDTPSIRIQGSAVAPEESSVDFQDLVTINTRLARGIHIENTSLDVDGMRSRISFSGITTVNNDNVTPSSRSALFIRNGAGTLAFGTFTVNDALLDETINDSAVDIRDVTGGVGFDSILINNAQGVGAVAAPAIEPAGLFVDNVASFTTVDGAIEVFDATAVNIENTDYQVTLTSVDSINVANRTDFGIRLVNNVGTFTIQGDGATLGSGGLITNTVLAGLFADDADQVFIALQDYDDNDGVGLRFLDMNENDLQGFVLDSLQVLDTSFEAVLATNVRNITIEDSFFQNNGFANVGSVLVPVNVDTIAIEVAEVPDDPTDANDQDNPENFPYTYIIQRNDFLDTFGLISADGVSIQTTSGDASGARVDLFFLDNNFLLFDRAQGGAGGLTDFASLLFMDWDGIINAEIRRNLGTLGNGSGQRGFDLNQTNIDDPLPSRINMTDNQLTFGDGPLLVGANFAFVNTALMTIDNNNFTFGSSDVSTDGLRFRLLDLNNAIDITNNTFVYANGGTGVRVELVNDSSNFFIEGNRIGAPGALADRGFRFDTINGTANLFGVAPNFVDVVNPANPNNFFSIGSGAVNGQINVNGTSVP